MRKQTNALNGRGPVVVMLVAVMTITLAGCSESPKEKYQDAMQQVKNAKQNRQDAEKKLNKKKKSLADAREDVREAQVKYQKSQAKVDQASKSVDKVVSDALLFRGIQRQLVNKDKFDESAISVSVDHRVVTLSGTVPNDEVRKKAVKIARDKPGVKNVVDSLRVQKPQSEQSSGKGDNKAQKQQTNGS